MRTALNLVTEAINELDERVRADARLDHTEGARLGERMFLEHIMELLTAARLALKKEEDY